MSISPERPLDRAAPAKTGGDPVVSFAVCVDCGADIDDWRERLLPIRTGALTITEHGALALRIDREGVCDECGGEHAEIRVEPRAARPRLGS